jgi:hypothetical protein
LDDVDVHSYSGNVRIVNVFDDDYFHGGEKLPEFRTDVKLYPENLFKNRRCSSEHANRHLTAFVFAYFLKHATTVLQNTFRTNKKNLTKKNLTLTLT